MATTSLGIYYPDETTNITPLHTVLGAMSSSVDGVLVGPVYRTPMGVHVIADAAARAGLLASLTSGGYTPGASNPVLIYQVDTALQYMYNGTSWVPVAGPPAFASTGARDTDISAPVTGMQVTTGSGTSQQAWIYSGSTWELVWQKLPKPRRLRMNGTETVPSGVGTSIKGWVGQAEDPGNVTGGISFSNTTGYFTVPTSGIYAFGIGTYWASNTAGVREIQFRHNAFQRETLATGASAEGTARNSLNMTVWCEAGDTAGFSVRQNTGADLLFGHTTVGTTWLTAAKIA